MYAYTRLTRNSLFLASPGDVQDLRLAANDEFDSIRRQRAEDLDVELFDWEKKFGPDFDQWVPPQAQIPLPNDERCRGLICLFGERLGTPLEANWTTEPLAHFATAQAGRFRLVHPWPTEMAEQEAKARDGGFALTGTTLELLTGLASNRLAAGRDDIERGIPPILLLLLGDDDGTVGQFVSSGGNSDAVNFANSRFRSRRLLELGSTTDSNLDQFLLAYRVQKQQLANFIEFLRLNNINPRVVAGEAEARHEIRAFILKALKLSDVEEDRDPYKGLQSYGIEDAGIYFGHVVTRRRAIDRLRALWADPQRPTFYSILGGSGVGKSSFMKAGILATLQDTYEFGSYLAASVRPSELAPPEGCEDPDKKILLSIVDACLAPMRAKLTPERLSALEQAREQLPRLERRHMPAEAVKLLSDTLEELPDRPRLVIGIDQFEELLDQRHAESGAQWDLAAHFIDAAARTPRLGVLHTMRADRQGLIEDDQVLGVLWNGGEDYFLKFPQDSLRDIISLPFEAVGLHLEDALVGTLQKKIGVLADDATGRHQGGLLPLVSLLLERIWTDVGRPKKIERLLKRQQEASIREREGLDDREKQFASASQPDGAAGGGNVITLEECSQKRLLDIDGIIDDLANKAVHSLSLSPTTIDESLPMLLRHLVEIDMSSGQRMWLPERSPPTHDNARELVQALEVNRLIVRSSTGRIRLVHEAVIRGWQKARTWYEAQPKLHIAHRRLAEECEQWLASGRSEALLKKAGLNMVERAALVLAEMWQELTQAGADDENGCLRDYALSLLRTHPDPRCVVEDSAKKTMHVHIVAHYGDVETLRVFLSHDPGCATVMRETDGRTPLFTAMRSAEAADLILGAAGTEDVNAILDSSGWSPLHTAAAYGSAAVVRRLIEAGFDVNAKGPDDTTPAMVAIDQRNWQTFAALLDEDATDLTLMPKDEWGMLHRAAYNRMGDPLLIGKLIERARDTIDVRQSDGWTPIMIAAQFGEPALIEALWEAGADASARIQSGYSSLHLAALNGRADAVQALLGRCGCDVNALTQDDKVQTALHAVAVREGRETPIGRHIEVASVLVEAGADRSIRNNAGLTPLHAAVARMGAGIGRLSKDEETLLRILAKGAPSFPDKSGQTPLAAAYRSDNLAVATVLLEEGARLAELDDALPALHAAARAGDIRRLRFLMRHGVDLEVRDSEGWCALHHAAEGREFGVLKLLTDAAPSLIHAANRGVQPIHVAALGGSEHVVSWLLDHGVRPDATDDDGLTPLHYAAEAGHQAIVTKFLEQSANRPEAAMAGDHEGRTPLQFAALAGRDEVVRTLMEEASGRLADAPFDDLDVVCLAAEAGRVSVLDAADRTLEAFKRRERGTLSRLTQPFSRLQRTLWKQPQTGWRSDGDGGPLALALSYGQHEAALWLIEKGRRLRRRSAAHRAAVQAFQCFLDAALPQTGEAAATVERIRAALTAWGFKVTDPRAAAQASRPAAARTDPRPAKAQTPTAARSPAEASVAPSGTRVFARTFEASPPHYPWEPVAPTAAARLIERINPIDGRYRVTAGTTEVVAVSLPWYEGVQLLRIRDSRWVKPDLYIYYLAPAEDGDTLFRLDGTSPPIHQMNAELGLKLDAETALAYLRFFCFFVRAEEGPFYVLEDPRDPVLPELEGPARDVVEGTARRPALEGRNEAGQFLCSAVVFYSNAIFLADFALHPTGMVEMLDDEPIAADLPARVTAPLA